MNNILYLFNESVQKLRHSPCIWHEHRDKWMEISWHRFSELVWSAAAGWRKNGIKPGDRVAVFGPTSWNWTLADMSLLATGAIVVPIYQTIPPHAVKKILEDANIKLVVGDRKLWQDMGHPEVDFISYRTEGNKCIGDIIQEGRGYSKEIIQEAIAYDLDMPATIVYTSGTTGDPKGVVITHKNIAAETKAVREIFLFPHHYIGIACLPLSHVLGRMMQFYQLAHGCQTAYVPDLTKLADAYKKVKPHYLCVVPRLLEKINEGIETAINNKSSFARNVFNWSKKVCDDYTNHMQWCKPMTNSLKLRHFIADMLVFKKVRAALGGRVKAIVCGGAPLSKSLARLLNSAGIKVLEGYGLTETFAAVTVNRVDDFRIGTIGKPISGVEIKFADDRELLIKGDVVFKEYWNKPEETEAAFTKGWFKSGDLGEFTRDGFVRLTGRKKEIIITAGGKNIEPTPIEDRLKEIPFITQAVLYGDGKKFLSAVVALDPVRIREEATKNNHKLSDDLTSCPITKNIIAEEIEKKNIDVASFEKVRKFVIVPRPLSIENGELTPTLKVRREIIAKKYQTELEKLYNES